MSKATSSHPNVVFVLSDEHRWQSMSFTEQPGLHTPNMQRLAAEGASFTNCISNYPVCSPARAIIMTGRWPFHMTMSDDSPGMIDNGFSLSPDQETIGKAFRSAGYKTGYIGKWHLGHGHSAVPFGFDYSRIWTKTNQHWQSAYFDDGGSGPIETEGYNATLMTNQALEFIENCGDQRFFLIVSPNPPHFVFTDPPEDKRALYPDTNALPYRGNVDLTREEADWSRYQGYHAHVTAIDEELGRLLDALEGVGIADKTLFVYSSDHGSMLSSHRMGNKRYPHHESIRVPLLLRLPGVIPQGLASSSLFGLIDLMPTLCEITGVAAPPTCEGRDLSDLLLGRAAESHESQFLMHIFRKGSGDLHAPYFRGVITDEHTYAYRVAGEHHAAGPWQLWDNAADPYQRENLVDQESHRVVRRRLQAEVLHWLRRAGDPALTEIAEI